MTHTDDLIMPTIGELLRMYRWEDPHPKIHPKSLTGKITQKVLAERAGPSIPTIRNLENGKGTIDSLKRVMDELELVLEIYIPKNKEEEESIFTKNEIGRPYLRIGTQIKLIRRQKGYSQRKFAELTEVSHPTIVAIERHEKGKLSNLESIILKSSEYPNVLPMCDMWPRYDIYKNNKPILYG
jgi:transcriptional regulator with XRE-family HTH domain